jgi:hypothetical protein
MQKLLVFVCLLFLLIDVFAIDKVSFDTELLSGKDLRIENAVVTIAKVAASNQSLTLTADRMVLPKPFNDIRLVNIQCPKFIATAVEISCDQGRAQMTSAYWQSPKTRFSFRFTETKQIIVLSDTVLGASKLELEAEIQKRGWQLRLKADNIGKDLLQKVLPVKALPMQTGRLRINAMVTGQLYDIRSFDITATGHDINGQSDDGKYAAEKLVLTTTIHGTKKAQLWSWQQQTKLEKGSLYADPVFLTVGDKPIVFTADGYWHNLNRQVEINHFTYQHPDICELNGQASISYAKALFVDKASINGHSRGLQKLVAVYITPYFTEPFFKDAAISGTASAQFRFVQQQLTDARVEFNQLKLMDVNNTVAIGRGDGTIDWSADAMTTKFSKLTWRQLTLRGIPFAPGEIEFRSQGRQIEIAKKTKFELLDGTLSVDAFSMLLKKQEEPDVSFAGSLDELSLEKLTQVMQWTPLTGNISGQIPGVNYHNKTLSLGGELLIRVFDGSIKLTGLTSAGLFSDFPRLTSQIEVDNLDLEQLTGKFEFGSITGRLSGFIKDLVLENWSPVGFFAWFGTPDDDDSAHHISQKAVNNIASIGGGGASDLLSRSFLSFFDTFRYDKIGIGCYLHNGVCQMMGLEAADEGYYLIKGGWLPRVDVLGYNPRVNWDVLVERLARVAAPEQAIIQ